jgi:hypothetical protein
MRASSSPNRCFTLATSMKPPQVGNLLFGGGQLRFDDVEHTLGVYARTPTGRKVDGEASSATNS